MTWFPLLLPPPCATSGGPRGVGGHEFRRRCHACICPPLLPLVPPCKRAIVNLKRIKSSEKKGSRQQCTFFKLHSDAASWAHKTLLVGCSVFVCVISQVAFLNTDRERDITRPLEVEGSGWAGQRGHWRGSESTCTRLSILIIGGERGSLNHSPIDRCIDDVAPAQDKSPVNMSLPAQFIQYT